MYNIENFELEINTLHRKRIIRVYLPSDYSTSINKRYKVIYIHDGHNLFYKETSAFGGIWDIQSAMNKWESEGRDGIIVVGIDCNQNGGRFDEYSPWINENLTEMLPTRNIHTAGGEGELYIDFIVKFLKPYIDKKYRTLPDRNNTFIAGSSMGAFISLYAGYKYNDVFSGIGAFSTAAWFKKDSLIEFLKENFKEGTKVYLDIGTKETSDDNNKDFNNIYLNDTKEIANLFLNLGQDKKDLFLFIDEGANHSEESWKRRFPMFLDYMFQ